MSCLWIKVSLGFHIWICWRGVQYGWPRSAWTRWIKINLIKYKIEKNWKYNCFKDEANENDLILFVFLQRNLFPNVYWEIFRDVLLCFAKRPQNSSGFAQILAIDTFHSHYCYLFTKVYFWFIPVAKLVSTAVYSCRWSSPF